MKSELVDQTRMIMWEILTESRRAEREEREERQATTAAPLVPLAPQFRSFDLDAETSGKWPIENDQETLIAEPITRQRLDILEEVEKLECAKDLAKTMAQMKIQMKKKGIDAPIDYADLNLDEDDDPMPLKFKFPDIRKFNGTDDPHLHLKLFVSHMRSTGLTKPQIVK